MSGHGKETRAERARRLREELQPYFAQHTLRDLEGMTGVSKSILHTFSKGGSPQEKNLAEIESWLEKARVFGSAGVAFPVAGIGTGALEREWSRMLREISESSRTPAERMLQLDALSGVISEMVQGLKAQAHAERARALRVDEGEALIRPAPPVPMVGDRDE